MNRRTTTWLLGSLFAVAPQVAFAATLPASFSLGKYVPGDWGLYIHEVHNPERQWVEEQWAEVWDALVKTGLDKDILSLVSSIAGDGGGAGIGAAVDAAKNLASGVQWGDLIKREFVFAEKFSLPMPEYLVLTRGVKGSGASNAKGLAAILAHVVSMIDQMNVVASQERGVNLWTLNPKSEVPFGLQLFQKGDVVGVFVGQASRDSVLSLVSGAASTRAIVDQPRFQEALTHVARPEDSLVYYDAQMLLSGLKSLINDGFKKTCEGEGEGAAKSNGEQDVKYKDADAMAKVVAKAVGMLDVLDYTIVSVETKGRQQFTHAATKLLDGKNDSPIVKMVLDRKSFQPFDQYIPVDATGFTIDGFVDLGLLYHTLMDFVANEIPDGKAFLDKWTGIQASFGFDVERDLFSWWSGEMISVNLPAAMATPMGGGDGVLMIRVKDSALAAKKVETALNFVTAKATEAMGMPLILSPLSGELDGFKQVTFQPMAMFLRPVVGVKGDWLMFASSPGALEKCLDVAAGKAPSIMKNERFRSEGLVPKGAVRSASFTDTSKFGEELGQGLGMASMVGGMMGMGMGGQAGADPGAKDKQQLIQKVFGLMMKLGPVVQKIDFYSSESSLTTHEGLFCYTQKVTTYKKHEAKTAGSVPRK